MQALQELTYGDYQVMAAATRYADGMIRVSATLAGGARHARSFFRFQSAEDDEQTACESALRDLCRLIDELCSSTH